MTSSTRDSFLATFEKVYRRALRYGAQSAPIQQVQGMPPFRDGRHVQDFLAACHRGYELAQQSVLDEIEHIRSDSLLPVSEKRYRELVLRKIIDGIAWAMLRQEFHIARRMMFHQKPVFTQIEVIMVAIEHAKRLNAESRMTLH
jgi:hypothetical protein